MAAILKRWLCFIVCLAPSSLWAYGYLSEFLSADGTTLRTNTIFPTDQIVNPKWNTSSAINVKFCTGGDYGSANIFYQDTKATELLGDISTALSSWVICACSSLSFGSITADASCGAGNAASNDGENRIWFTDNLPAGVIAFTEPTLQVIGGEVFIVDVDIAFSSTISLNTNACNVAASPSMNCSRSSSVLSFLGVLVHEMGHFLGISHSIGNDDNSSDGSNRIVTMFPQIANNEESRAIESLELDDQLAKLNLYPSSNFPTDTGGTVSGTIYRAAGVGNRAAHVTAFDITNKRMLAGIFSSMSGTRINPNGNYSLRGIPFDTDFVIFVEPAQRTSINSNLTYASYAIPIEVALLNNLDGLLSFAIEVYPDASIVDVRATRNADTSPSFSSARTFRLTSSSPHISDINFYLSSSFSAPNDGIGATLTLGASGTITNSNPLTLTISTNTDLSIYSSPSLSLTATRLGTTQNWSSGLPSVTYTGSSTTLTIDPTSFSPIDGTYVVTATLTSSNYPALSAESTVSVSDWTGTSESANSGGGGCSLRIRQ